MDEVHFVVVRAVLADAGKWNAHARHKTLLACSLDYERLGATVRSKRKAKYRVFDNNFIGGGTKQECRRCGCYGYYVSWHETL